MAYNKVVYAGEVLVDLSGDTVTPDKLLSGVKAHDASGSAIVGTYEDAGLNFGVVGGTTQPTDPAENTIWVNTDTEISCYAFSATEPESLVEGMVWFKTATESTTPINVDKKNTVILYPQTAQQYVSGAWVGKTAQVYTDGAWHELWDGYYYKLGECYEGITGGYSAGTSLAKVTFNSNNMVITQASGTSAGNVVATVNTVDVTNVNTLVFDCHADAAGLCSVGVGSVRDNWNNYIATANVNNTARALVTLDVSSITGEVYILLRAWYNSAKYQGNLTVYNIYKQ